MKDKIYDGFFYRNMKQHNCVQHW